MILDDIFHVLRGEREYHLRRWGVRQPDGTMAEQPHSVGDFVIYLRDYYNEAAHYMSRSPDIRGTQDTLRKIVALALACLEQNDRYENGKYVTLEDLFETVRNTGRMVPLHSRHGADFATYMLKIRQCLVDAEVKLAAMNPSAARVILREIVQIGVECFERYGVPGRPVVSDVSVTNMRDGLPA